MSLAAAAGWTFLLACASAPSGKRAIPERPPRGAAAAPPAPGVAELEKGRQMAALFFGREPLIDDDRLLRYVNLVGRTVTFTRGGPERFHFAVTDSGVPYGTAFPGGFIVVSRGALSLMDSEAELAVALAREVCRGQSPGSGDEAAGSSEDGAGGASGDACGAQLAASAGYDASAFLHYLSALQARADSARQRLDLQVRIDRYRKLPESSRGGKSLVERFRRSAMS